MAIRPSCLCLSLLACLGIQGVAPAAAEPVFPDGLAIPIDAAALARRICDENPSKSGGTVECHARVKNHKAGDFAGALRIVSAEPVATPCGLWDATLTLAPLRLQLVTHLHLANRETGRTADFTLRPGPGPAGRWVLSPAGKAPDRLFLADDTGNEQIIPFEGCIPAWVYDDPTLEVIPEEGCEACPEEDPELPPGEEMTGGPLPVEKP